MNYNETIGQNDIKNLQVKKKKKLFDYNLYKKTICCKSRAFTTLF